MSEINLSKYNLHTDLIIDNDHIKHSDNIVDDLRITKTDKDGHYLTITFDDITDKSNYQKVLKHLNIAIKDILKTNHIESDVSCLIIGLGNRLSTPDSLGVKVASKITVTAHLYEVGEVSDGIRKVSVFTPGVMATTGIESAKIITALTKAIKPGFIIAIDALASSNITRINKTIQLTDTGIHPGSGIGNNRMEISKKTIGIPVIAIGVPTVVMSSTIVYDTLNYLIKHIAYLKENESISKLTYRKTNYLKKLKDKTLSTSDKENLLGLFGSLNEIDKQTLINEVLENTELNMIVTPTEIDFLIEKLSSLIADSINITLHN